MNLFRHAMFLALIIATGSQAFAEWQADPTDDRQVKAAAAIEQLRERIPRTHFFFDEAYGYAILPSVTRIGVGFGGAYCRCIVI